jgi:hypothetical protein
MTRTVFFGFGAYVGAITGLSTCRFWDDDPRLVGWAATAQVPVDLARNPSAVRAGTLAIDDIQVDDHRVDGGLTTIGQCWLSEQYYASLANRPPRHPASAPADAHDYELTSMLYWDGPLGGRRFYGFHARIAQTAGTVALVEIWAGGTGKITGRAPAGAWWLDLAQVAHPVEPGVTEIAVGATQLGALFLDSVTTRSLMLAMTKRPIGTGADDYPG